jgi:membrane protease YdiL (CAAX protease family)
MRRLYPLSSRVVELYAARVRRHPIVTGIIFLIGVMVVLERIESATFMRRIAYPLAPVLGVLILDFFYVARPQAQEGFPVRRPKIELLAAGVCLFVVVVWLLAYFSTANGSSSLLAKRPPFPLIGMFFVRSIPLALFELLVIRYKWTELGVRLRGFAPALTIVICFALLAWLSRTIGVAFHQQMLRAQGSVVIPLVAGFESALAEEFFRFIWQTRLGAVLDNPACGWLMASLLWACLHAPQMHGHGGWLSAFDFAINIAPMGLLFGYATHRTRSILPSVILHGLNYWGL